MRTLTTGLVAVAATASLAFTVAPALDSETAPDLETVPYMDTDLAGDGNGLNGQGLAEGAVPETATGPAHIAEGDILGARITSLYEEVEGADGLTDRVLTGLEFRTGLAAEPTATSAPLIHRFIGSTGGCTFWVQSYTGTNGSTAHGTASVRLFDTSCGLEPTDDPLGASETVTGDWITWSWDADHGEMVVALDFEHGLADERITSRIDRGEYYLLEYLENRVNTGVITAPVIDEMTGGGYAVIGADIPADEEPAAETEPTSEEGGSETGGTES